MRFPPISLFFLLFMAEISFSVETRMVYLTSKITANSSITLTSLILITTELVGSFRFFKLLRYCGKGISCRFVLLSRNKILQSRKQTSHRTIFIATAHQDGASSPL